MSKQYKTVLFDFGGTLDADGVAWKERVHRHYRDEGLAMSAAAFDPRFYAADDRLVGTLPQDADLRATLETLTANLEEEFAHSGKRADPGRGARAANRFLAEASEAFARNRPLLALLAGRYRLGIVSNFYGNLEAVCRGAGLAEYFSVMVDSHRLGAEKPDPAIFQAAMAPLDAEPDTTLFVGDSLRRDREGARRLGMDFLWIAPAETQRAEARQTPLGHGAVTRLGELAAILT
jgi:HAD superfamily hydrolase (TIGR01549 family)